MNTRRRVVGLLVIGLMAVVCLVGVAVLVVPRALEFWTFGSAADVEQSRVSREGAISMGYRSVELVEDRENTVSASVEELDSEALRVLQQGAQGMLVTTPMVVSTERPLEGSVQLVRTYPEALPEGVSASFVYFYEELGQWVPVVSALSSDRKTLTATVDQLGMIADVVGGGAESLDKVAAAWGDDGRVVEDIAQIGDLAGAKLMELSYQSAGGGADVAVGAPSCQGEVPEWVDASVAELANRDLDPALWCAGAVEGKPSVLEVRATNTQGYPLALTSSAYPNELLDGGTNSNATSEALSRAYREDVVDSYSPDLLQESGLVLMPGETKILQFSQKVATSGPLELQVHRVSVLETLCTTVGQQLAEAPQVKSFAETYADCIAYTSGVVKSSDSADDTLAGGPVTRVALNAIRDFAKTELKDVDDIEAFLGCLAISWQMAQYTAASAIPEERWQAAINFDASADTSTDTALSATEVIVMRMVDAHGVVQPGYSVTTDHPITHSVSCTPSYMSKDPGVLTCGSSAEALPVCYPGPAGQQPPVVYCARKPEDTQLMEIEADKHYGLDAAASSSMPWKIELENGQECIARNGGAWGSASDGRIGQYFCGESSEPVVSLPEDPFSNGIDDRGDVWLAQMGELADPNSQLPPPEMVGIQRAYFAGVAP